MTASLKAFLKDIYHVAGWRVLLLVGVTFASALLEGATLAALVPLLARAGVGQNGLSGIIARIFDSLISWLGLPHTAFGEIVLVGGLIGLSAAVFLAQAYLSARLQTDYVASLQRRLLRAFFSADYGFFRSRSGGELISLATTEPARLGFSYIQVNLIVTSAMYIVVQMAIAVLIAPLVVVLVVVFAALLFVSTQGLMRRAHQYGRRLTAANSALQIDAGELIAGAKFVKATGTESRAVERLDSAIERMRQPSFANTLDVQIVRAVFEYASGFFIVMLIAVAPVWLAVDVGAILVVIAMFVRLFPKVSALRQTLQSFASSLPSFDAVSGMMARADRAREKSGAGVPAGWRAAGPAAVSIANLSVVDGARRILSGVDFSIPAGSFVVIAGPTGAGKTTLLDCMLGLRRATSGGVLIDGHALDSLPVQTWRKAIGYLGQDPVLFNASIADNLRWIKPDTTDAEIVAALDMAAADFVKRLPDGIQTMVGDHGNRLSGGERQRLALARALLGNPRLLVLDEATSALDAATEESVVASIRSLRGAITIVAITHRPALADAADVLIEMQDGRVTSFGPAKGARAPDMGIQPVRAR